VQLHIRGSSYQSHAIYVFDALTEAVYGPGTW
jgi:hypothetical protein